MSYTCTASCVATAYTIRYGRPNAGTGPPGGALLEGDGSESSGGLGDAIVATLVEGDGADVSGGGSMLECEVGGIFVGSAGSGSGGMSSSGLRVSMVISFVSLWLTRR